MMKGAIEQVAEKRGIERGVLANHMAWRLADQKLNWWGAAENMQKSDASPSSLVLKYLMEHSDLAALNEIDRDMFQQAMATT